MQEERAEALQVPEGILAPGIPVFGESRVRVSGVALFGGTVPKRGRECSKKGTAPGGTARETEPFGLVWILPSTVRDGEVRLGARPLDSIASVAG